MKYREGINYNEAWKITKNERDQLGYLLNEVTTSMKVKTTMKNVYSSVRK